MTGTDMLAEMDDEYQQQSSAAKKIGKQHNTLPLWGNEATMNLNPLILANIQGSSYFKVHLFKLKTYHEVVDEIYYQVKHMEPWERGSRKTSGQTGMCGGVRGVGAGGIVSTAYCLLYKLYTLRLTRKQVNGLLNHTDSPYIRALGFMYLRYTQPPADLYGWYEDYFQDEEEIDVKAGGGQTITIGQVVYQFLTKLDWFSTLFPRIPVPIQKQIEKKLEEYCRKNNISQQQLSSARNAASNSGGVNYDYDDAVYDRRSGGASSSRSRLQQASSGSYRDEHDNRDNYCNRRREDSPSNSYHSSRDRDHYREKHKKKHKRKHLSRSRSRSRCESRIRTERRKDLDCDRDRERERERNRPKERDFERRGRDYEERRYR